MGRKTVGSLIARLGATVMLAYGCAKFFVSLRCGKLACSLPDIWLAGSLTFALSQPSPHLQSDSQGTFMPIQLRREIFGEAWVRIFNMNPAARRLFPTCG